MFNIEESFDGQLLAVQKNRPVVVLTEPLDGRILEAVCYLTRYIKPVLLAAESDVRAAAARHLGHLDPSRVEYSLSECAYLDIARRPDLVEEFAADCLAHHPHGCEAADAAGARQSVSRPGIFGVYAVRRGHADMVVGGAVHSPRTFFRPMLSLLANRPVVCQVGLFVLPDDFPLGYFPHNIVVFGDVGVNAVMTPEILAEVAVGTCAVARDLIPEDVLPEIQGALVLVLAQGIGRRTLARDRAARAGAGAGAARASGAGGQPLPEHPDCRRGQVQRRDLAAVRRALRRAGAGGRDQRDYLPQPGDGEPAVPPLRRAVPRGEEVPRDLRHGVPGRGPRDGLDARGCSPGHQGVRAPAAARWALDAHPARHLFPTAPRACPQPRVHLHESRRLRGRPGDPRDRDSGTPPRHWPRSRDAASPSSTRCARRPCWPCSASGACR